MLIMQCWQPLILIFQFFKIFEQRNSTPLSLNPGSVLRTWFAILEGDLLIVSRALNHSSSVPVSIDAVIIGIGKASLEFHNVDFSHVKRNANTPAYLLAKYVKGIDNQCIWMENCPSFLELAVLHDVNATVVWFILSCVISYNNNNNNNNNIK